MSIHKIEPKYRMYDYRDIEDDPDYTEHYVCKGKKEIFGDNLPEHIEKESVTK